MQKTLIIITGIGDRTNTNYMNTNFLIDAKERKSQTSKAIHKLALDGLLYLDTRTDFWRQQKPMYARKRDKYLQQNKANKRGNDPVKFTLQKLKAIDEGTLDMHSEPCCRV